MRPAEDSTGILLENIREQRAAYTGAALTHEVELIKYLRLNGCHMGVFEHINVNVLRAARHPSTHAIHDIMGRRADDKPELFIPYEHAHAAFSGLARVASMRPLTAKFFGINTSEIQYVLDTFWVEHNPFNESVA